MPITMAAVRSCGVATGVTMMTVAVMDLFFIRRVGPVGSEPDDGPCDRRMIPAMVAGRWRMVP